MSWFFIEGPEKPKNLNYSSAILREQGKSRSDRAPWEVRNPLFEGFGIVASPYLQPNPCSNRTQVFLYIEETREESSVRWSLGGEFKGRQKGTPSSQSPIKALESVYH